LVATNSNDILARAIATGVYRRGEVVATHSPAMDIQVASNFERLYFEAVGRDAAATARAFHGFAAGEAIELPPASRWALQTGFKGVSVSEADTSQAMADTLVASGELIDPHTAVALAAQKGTHTGPHPLIVLSTAHPAKFPDAVRAATGVEPPIHRHAADLHIRPERIDRLPADVEAVKAYVRAFVSESS
jgi:threonine synthase